MTLGSGSALSPLTGSGVSIVTGGPPSVAIFIAAMFASGATCVPADSDAAGGSVWLAGNEASSGIAILVSTMLTSAILVSAVLTSAVLVSTILVSTILVSATESGASAGADVVSFCVGLSATALSAIGLSATGLS